MNCCLSEPILHWTKVQQKTNGVSFLSSQYSPLARPIHTASRQQHQARRFCRGARRLKKGRGYSIAAWQHLCYQCHSSRTKPTASNTAESPTRKLVPSPGNVHNRTCRLHRGTEKWHKCSFKGPSTLQQEQPGTRAVPTTSKRDHC